MHDQQDAAHLGREAMRRVRRRSVCTIEPGLTAAEFDAVEAEFGFRFAADHRAFLAAGLPVNAGPGGGQPWPDWRSGDRAALRQALNRPREGVLFDVGENSFWYAAWGPRPADRAAALATATARLAGVPALVPVYGHRYLPGAPGASGHPVLSVWQTDIICYGHDLAGYIDHEFGGEPLSGAPVAGVAFWADLIT